MKIFIDIGHPAHVHYFKHMIFAMQAEGHSFFISAREKEFTFSLLEQLKIPYYNRGKGARSAIGKLIQMFLIDIKLLIKAIRFKPDLFLSFASPYTAQVSWIMRRPCITMDDTEHAKFGHAFYKPFTNVFLNPVSFSCNFGGKQIKFNSYMELSYLHPNYFKPQKAAIYKELNLPESTKIGLIRIVSFAANHDIGHKGLDSHTLQQLVTELSHECKVYISSEKILPDQFSQFIFPLSPDKMHDVLAVSDLFVGEGATMASECAMLGTPAIYINTIECATLTEQEEKYKLVYNFRTSDGVVEKALELIKSDAKQLHQKRREILLNDQIDITKYMIWFISNYPESFVKLKTDNTYQFKFK